ncbi:MAG: histidine kinase [Pseudomonadota bacterium]|nr:histidine kinase [Pseudomonadota bacterium]
MTGSDFKPAFGALQALRNSLRVSWTTALLIAAINTGVAALLWIEDPRPFWHPFVSAQCFGFAIAYCVNVASPWEKRWPVARLIAAVAVGSALGMLLVVMVKGLPPIDWRVAMRSFGLTMMIGFFNGLFVSLFFLFKFREARTEAALLKAQAAQHLLSKQAIETELKLMQAQVEPHFLFNTLASVQYLTETDPPQAGKLLGHLLAYLRAALPQLRTTSTALGKEVEMAEAYLNILKMRMGPRLEFHVDVPEAMRDMPFPPGLLISVVENAIEHGLQAQAQGGSVTIAAQRVDGRLQVTVTDTGGGVAPGQSRLPGRGIGLANVRDRLAALYGGRGHFALENTQPRGARAVIEIPAET